MSRPLPRSLKAATSYFALTFSAGFVMGLIRVPFVQPRLGARLAELLEMPLMLLVIVFAARFVVRHFALPNIKLHRLAVGLLALHMMLGAELLLAVALQERSLSAYIASRDPISGLVYLGMLLLFALMPALLNRR